MSKTTFEQVIAEKGKLVYTNVGDSMYPLILPRDLLVIEAVRQPLRRYDIPLYRRDSGQYVLHRIVAVNGDGSYAMCGDNRSQCEFGITDRHIIGVLTAIVRDGKTIPVQELPNPSQIKAAEDLILLLTCAVNGEAPDSGACAAMCLPAVYRLAAQHSVLAAAAYALERTVELPRPFDQAMKKAIRKQGLFDIERARIIGELEQAQIRYLPLKGILLKDCYPLPTMREMSDNDILCDPARMSDVRDIMERLGYSCEQFDEYNHDVYAKPPTLEFEMHRSLFEKERGCEIFAAYYDRIWERLLPVSACGFRMTEEDSYLYLLCHMYKHYSHAGTGLRSLLDVYLFLRTHPGLDREYLDRELSALRLTEFERDMRQLAEKVFTRQPLSERAFRILIYLILSGNYGTAENAQYHSDEKKLGGDDSKEAKRKYFLGRVFLSGETLEKNYPFVARHRILYPALLVYRPIKGALTHPKGIIGEYRRIKKFKKKDEV